MRTIWKYTLKIEDYQELDQVPCGSEILHFGTQDGVYICVWILIDTNPELENETLRFHIRGTGNPVPENASYIATVQCPPLVWHVFLEE